MFLDSRIADAQPLMIVGGPRCGTRLAADIMNTHPRILLRGELPSAPAKAMIDFAEKASSHFDAILNAPASEDRPIWRSPDVAKAWQASRHELMYAMWSTINKRLPEKPASDIEWFGHKTPRHDQHWRFYREFFGEPGPRYVFCMRNFTDHYLSLTAMTGQGIRKVAADYRDSVNRYAEMKAELGNRVSLFILDDFKREGLPYARRVLFTDLGIDPDDEALAQIDPGAKVNTLRQDPRDRLSDDEITFLDDNPDLGQALDALRTGRSLTTG